MMRAKFFFCMIFMPWMYLFANPCALDGIKSERDIQKSYQFIKKKALSCQIHPEEYLDFTKQAFLAEQYSLAIWSSKKGMEHTGKKPEIHDELNYFLGISYLENGRFEDAIKTLRQIVFQESSKKKYSELIQKAHLALIEAYFKRSQKQDENVNYLIRLYKNRYADSGYLFTLRSWNANASIR